MQRLFEWVRDRVLRVLRVPHEPEPPAGAPGSIRAFRAGRNFYKLRLLRWGAGQIGALFGIIFSLSVLESVERGANAFREEARLAAEAAKAAARPAAPAAGDAAPQAAPADEPSAPKSTAKRKRSRGDWKQQLGRTSDRWPMWVFPLLRILEWGGVLLYLVQIPVTYAMARLDFELRWYIVTDRSLRIRSGLASVQEMTMSFANVQQVVVAQGPLQRLLGIADVRVQSAGGGGGGEQQGAHDSTHTGVFHGVENANEIRDLILARLRQFREAGLGDPDDQSPPVVSGAPNDETTPVGSDPLLAAREILEEARALRRAVT